MKYGHTFLVVGMLFSVAAQAASTDCRLPENREKAECKKRETKLLILKNLGDAGSDAFEFGISSRSRNAKNGDEIEITAGRNSDGRMVGTYLASDPSGLGIGDLRGTRLLPLEYRTKVGFGHLVEVRHTIGNTTISVPALGFVRNRDADATIFSFAGVGLERHAEFGDAIEVTVRAGIKYIQGGPSETLENGRTLDVENGYASTFGAKSVVRLGERALVQVEAIQDQMNYRRFEPGPSTYSERVKVKHMTIRAGAAVAF